MTPEERLQAEMAAAQAELEAEMRGTKK